MLWHFYTRVVEEYPNKINTIASDSIDKRADYWFKIEEKLLCSLGEKMFRCENIKYLKYLEKNI